MVADFGAAKFSAAVIVDCRLLLDGSTGQVPVIVLYFLVAETVVEKKAASALTTLAS